MFACQSDVHGQRHGGTDADGRTVDRTDDRLVHGEHAQGHRAAAVPPEFRVGLVAQLSVAECLGAGGEIGARAESAPRSGDDHRPHGVVGIGEIQCLDDLGHHRAREGVQFVGPVQRDGCDAVVNGVFDLRERGTHQTSRNREAAIAEPTAPTMAPITSIITMTLPR